MPTTPLRNALYRAALPLFAPSVRTQMTHVCSGRAIVDMRGYNALLQKHHVLGSTLYLGDRHDFARVDTSIRQPDHHAAPGTLYRVASITKMATALVTLMLMEDGCFSLDTPVAALLPDGDREEALKKITVRQLLCHTSGLRDSALMDLALVSGGSWHDVLRAGEARAAIPGDELCYSNLGFGLLGCVLEQATGMAVAPLFDQRLFTPLGMDATLDASHLDETRIMPISRVLPYKKGRDVRITRLGRVPLTSPDPLRHFGHTAGAMYTNATSLAKLLELILGGGIHDGKRLLKESSIAEMTREQSTYGSISPGMSYGLGLVILKDKSLSHARILGHQGYAYGCADGAFYEESTGQMVIFLNGGCSEAREGRLGLCNRDLLRWAYGKELPQWK